MCSEDVVRKVAFLESVNTIDISCGECHTISLSNSGEVYSWGGANSG